MTPCTEFAATEFREEKVAAAKPDGDPRPGDVVAARKAAVARVGRASARGEPEREESE